MNWRRDKGSDGDEAVRQTLPPPSSRVSAEAAEAGSQVLHDQLGPALVFADPAVVPSALEQLAGNRVVAEKAAEPGRVEPHQLNRARIAGYVAGERLSRHVVTTLPVSSERRTGSGFGRRLATGRYARDVSRAGETEESGRRQRTSTHSDGHEGLHVGMRDRAQGAGAALRMTGDTGSRTELAVEAAARLAVLLEQVVETLPVIATAAGVRVVRRDHHDTP